mgnify:CR=1 FL=1
MWTKFPTTSLSIGAQVVIRYCEGGKTAPKEAGNCVLFHRTTNGLWLLSAQKERGRAVCASVRSSATRMICGVKRERINSLLGSVRRGNRDVEVCSMRSDLDLSLIHISEPTRPY